MLPQGNWSFQAIESITPSTIHVATANRQPELVRMLIDAGADVNATCEFILGHGSREYVQGCTPLVVAVAVGCVLVIAPKTTLFYPPLTPCAV
jgi:hypothetical protein